MKKVSVHSPARPMLLSAAVILMVAPAIGLADRLAEIYRQGEIRLAAAQTSQKTIDRLAEQTEVTLEDYRQVLKQSEGLRVYVQRLDRQIEHQSRRIEDIEASINQVTVVQRQMPLIIESMIDSLEGFIALDLPFYAAERDERVALLRANLSRSDLSVAEKFRQVMEAYKIENEYGRKISTYKDRVELAPGVERDVTLLQIGRVALMYQTTDVQNAGAWDRQAGTWVELDDHRYRNAIRQAIRIAQNQAPMDILTVPVAAPERGQ